MKKNKSEIVFVLDESNSMNHLRESTVSNFNQFIKQQKEVKGECLVTVVPFASIVKDPIVNGISLSSYNGLTNTNYKPEGSTALYDAICKTVDDVGRRLSYTLESERPEKVIVVILTDGEENNSKSFKLEDVKSRIKTQQDVYKWDFVFLGANQDAVLTAQNMEIKTSAALTFSANHKNMSNSYASLSNYCSGLRSVGLAAFSDMDRVSAIN